MKIALIQLSASADKTANVAKATEMVRKALEAKARFVALPEVFNFRGDTRDPKAVRAACETVPGPSLQPLMELAQKYKAHILAGSVFETAPKGKAYNTSVLIGSRGKLTVKYRKIHLFDARLAGKIIKEADCFLPGKDLALGAVEEFQAGLTVCYDLRFAGLYRRYAAKGATLLTVPSCFTQTTGKAHWEVLLRARAIENLAYVIAPNQVGKDFRSVASFGNSMIVAPWGEVIARGSGHKEEIVTGSISLDTIKEARSKLPGIAA